MTSQSTILIVDDGILGRTTLETLLRHAGHHLVFATNGPEALTAAKDVIPDVILLDVMMPDMDGFEVCRRLRATPQLAEVPIILVTALDDRDSRIRGIEAGADDFVSKPFDRVELRTRVQTIIRLNRYRRLLAARAQFDWVVEQSGDGYLVVRQDGTISYANPQARRYLGLLDEDETNIAPVFRKQASRYYHCAPEDVWDHWLNLPEGTPLYLVLPESPTTAAFWLQVDCFDSADRMISDRLVRLRDITHEVSMQRDMRSFHAVIAHKLRTPLSSISTSLDLLQNTSINGSADMVAEIMQVARESVQRLRGELDDILQYIQTPIISADHEGMSLAELSTLIKDIGASLQLQAVTVAWQTGLETVQLPISPRVVELMFWEIMENSKKFHPNHVPAIDLFVFQSQPDRLHLLFRDNGVVLDPLQLSRVWVPYYQVEKEFTGQIDGMGLGLSLVSALIWSIGGSCAFRNRVDAPGVEVELVFPIGSLERMPLASKVSY